MRRNALEVVIGGCVPPKSLSFEHSLRAFVRCPIARVSCSHVANENKGRVTLLSCRADVLSRAATSVYVITFWVDLKGGNTDSVAPKLCNVAWKDAETKGALCDSRHGLEWFLICVVLWKYSRLWSFHMNMTWICNILQTGFSSTNTILYIWNIIFEYIWHDVLRDHKGLVVWIQLT